MTKNGPKMDYKGTINGFWRPDEYCLFWRWNCWLYIKICVQESKVKICYKCQISANYLILHSLNMKKWWFVVDELYLFYLRDVKSIQNNWTRHLAPSCDMLKIHFSLYAVVIVGEFSAATATSPIITHQNHINWIIIMFIR